MGELRLPVRPGLLLLLLLTGLAAAAPSPRDREEDGGGGGSGLGAIFRQLMMDLVAWVASLLGMGASGDVDEDAGPRGRPGQGHMLPAPRPAAPRLPPTPEDAEMLPHDAPVVARPRKDSVELVVTDESGGRRVGGAGAESEAEVLSAGADANLRAATSPASGPSAPSASSGSSESSESAASDDQLGPYQPSTGDQLEPSQPSASDQSEPFRPPTGDQSAPLYPSTSGQSEPSRPPTGDQPAPFQPPSPSRIVALKGFSQLKGALTLHKPPQPQQSPQQPPQSEGNGLAGFVQSHMPAGLSERFGRSVAGPPPNESAEAASQTGSGQLAGVPGSSLDTGLGSGPGPATAAEAA